jgi:hypothetical protein
MAFALTIAGVDVLDYLEPGPSLGFDQALQSRAIWRCVLKDYAGVYRPVRRQEVIATIDGVRVFGGVIQRFRETDFGNYIGNHCTIEAASFEKICDRRPFNGISLGPTLRDHLDHLVTVRLIGTGITRDPAMAAGPTIGPYGVDFGYLTDIFDELASIAGTVSGGNGWYWRIDPFKVIGFYRVGAVAAPRNLTDSNDTIRRIAYDDDDGAYVNGVIVQYGGSAAREYTDTFTGNGSTHLWLLTNHVVTPPGSLRLNGVTYPLAPYPTAGFAFMYRASDDGIIHDLGAPTLTGADVLEVGYVAGYPGDAAATNAGEVAAFGEYTIVEQAPTIFDDAEAARLAAAILRKRGGTPRRIEVDTITLGWAPGQSPTVTVAERAINASCLITDVKCTHEGVLADGGDQWRYDLNLVEGTEYPESWLKYFRDQQAGGSSGASSSGAVGLPSGGGPSPAAPPVLVAYLGGARNRPAYRPAAQVDLWREIPEAIDVEIDGDVVAVGSLRILCKTSDVACSVTPRLVSLVGAGGVRATVIATGTATAALVWTLQTIPVTFLPGRVWYRVEFTTSQVDVEVYPANAMLQN